ncbi:MAG: arginine biosynthesis bifunctional protein ArgJ [Armatimonadetes bacterium]|nr:MAG: arginine biosynthesis bifunctional protein ArgJ [Armatimonadota bacterium]
MAVTILPVEGGVCAPSGFRAAAARAGIRASDKDDLALIVSNLPCTFGAMGTQNLVRAWCVDWCLGIRPEAGPRAIVCNAGNANACNGPEGKEANLAMARRVAEALGLDSPNEVFVASTGVIGKQFPLALAETGIDIAARALEASPEASERAANAILTTDLVPKSFAVEVVGRGAGFRVGGIAKGSGMIAPNMATMLAFVTTDVRVETPRLQEVWRRVVDRTFHCVTVDGDTSTNDLALVLANGASGVAPDSDETLERALEVVCCELAKKIAADGEGATKLVTIRVTGAQGPARTIAKTIAESPLVKTALFGNDPNWGRILAAAGRSGEPIDANKASVWIGPHLLFAQGVPVPFDKDAVSESMKAKEVEVSLDLGNPAGHAATVWTCDFSYDYVRINAEYTT